MNSCFKRRIRTLADKYISDRQHDKWIGFVNKYYKNVMHDPDNTEIYIHTLLNGGKLDKDAVRTIAENKKTEINFEYQYCFKEDDNTDNRNNNHNLKYFLKLCLLEVEKCGRILSQRKF